MIGALSAILPRLRDSLGEIPLVFYAADINNEGGEPLGVPHALLQPVATPEDPDRYQAVAVLGLTVRGELLPLLDVQNSLRWMHEYRLPEYGETRDLYYRITNTTVLRNPDDGFVNGGEEVWTLNVDIRCTYKDLRKLTRPIGA